MLVIVLAVLLAAAFGAADQYLGSHPEHPWATEVSLLSAPWLLLPFTAGLTQREPRRAMLLGLACTLSALVGYGLMTLSPIEGAHLDPQSARGFVRSQSLVITAGLVTGPLFGWFGCRWRNDRAWGGALLTAAAFVLEPLARIPADQAIRSRAVWVAEVAVGLALMAYIASTVLSRRVAPRDSAPV